MLAPFLPPEAADADTLTELGLLFAGTSPFRFRLDRTGWFGADVLWLGPRDDGPFRALTQRVVHAFPAFPPFGGRFGDIVPHLTVGHGHPVTELRAAEDSVRARLPIDGHAEAVTWVTRKPAEARWVKAVTFNLGQQLAALHHEVFPEYE